MVNILDVHNLQISFPPWSNPRVPVKHLSFKVDEGSILGIVGQSGSGKSLAALAIMGMIPKPGRITNGSIRFKQKDLIQMKSNEYRQIRGKEIFLIFQGGGNALTPSMTIGKQIAEIFVSSKGTTWRQGLCLAEGVLEHVNLDPRILHLYPFELSGGMRQRIMIGMAIAIRPRLLIADEPTTGLDMITQAEILDIFKTLKTRDKVSIVFISHDLRIISQMADEVMVMFKGKNVDHVPGNDLTRHKGHPHTLDLLNACKTLIFPECHVNY